MFRPRILRIAANVAHLSKAPTLAKRNRVLAKKLYVGNLPFSATENELRQLFEKHGSVESVAVIMDRETGRPRGFAFVEMADSNGASAAMQALDGREFGGRALRVNEANERPQGGGGGGYGGNRRR
jgi:RNA recognition motif-containing protein